MLFFWQFLLKVHILGRSISFVIAFAKNSKYLYFSMLLAVNIGPCNSECSLCKDAIDMWTKLEAAFRELDVDSVAYKQWESTDRTELVTHTDTIDEFIERLIKKLQTLKVHQFIHDQQTRFFYGLKENLEVGKVLAVGDFSQNFAFVVQDAVQVGVKSYYKLAL